MKKNQEILVFPEKFTDKLHLKNSFEYTNFCPKLHSLS